MRLYSAHIWKPGDSSENIVFSDYTSGDLYRAGSSRGAIDPCFPAKIGIAHVHNLIAIKGARKQFNVIFFPMFDVLTSPLFNYRGSQCLPDSDGDSGNGESRLYQGNGRLQGQRDHVP